MESKRMNYEIINQDNAVVWSGPEDMAAYCLGLLCERFPDEWFRIRAIMFP